MLKLIVGVKGTGKTKEIISLIPFGGTLRHPVDRFQFDASYKIGQWSNRTGG